MKKQVAPIFLFVFVSFTLNIFAFIKADTKIVKELNQKIIDDLTVLKGQNVTFEDLISKLPEKSQEVARSLLVKRYEVGKRPIIGATQYGLAFPIYGTTQYGLAFQIYPEELMDLIPFIKGENKKILGLGSADGVNELFLSLFTEGENAETHIADIAPDEIALCKKHLKLLEEKHRQKVTTHCINIYDLKVKLAHLEGQFDLILARNIFHFIKPSEHAKFLELAKFFLKESGKLVIGVHTSKMAIEFNASCFQLLTYFVHNKDGSQKEIIRKSPRPFDSKTKNIDFLKYHVVYADRETSLPRVLTQTENLDVIHNQEEKEQAQNFLNTHPLSNGEYLSVLINTVQYLSATTLLEILHKNELWCEGISYYHSGNGHRINLDEIDDLGGFLSVVSSKYEVEKLYKESFEASQKRPVFLSKSFKTLEILSRKKDNIAVGFLDKLKINYEVFKLEHPSGKIEESYKTEEQLKEALMFSSWEIILKPLTREQFTSLKIKFRSNIKDSFYDSTRKYNLSEFLPRPWKDLMGKNFESKNRPDPNFAGRVIWSETNCYATAIASLNFLFSSNGKFPRFASDSDVFLELVDKMIKKRSSSFTSETENRAKAQTYNLGFIELRRDRIKHAYIFLDDTWIFERVGNNSLLPYRLAPREAVYKGHKFYHPHCKGLYVEEIIEIDPDKVEESISDDVFRAYGNLDAFEFSDDIYSP